MIRNIALYGAKIAFLMKKRDKMEDIKNNILETIGNTPLVKINALNTNGFADVVAKVEFFNPGGSVKDRVGISMINAAEKANILKAGATIIEPTSGNTGVGLAIAAAVKGYQLILTMPDTMSVERQKLLAAYGAQIVLTNGNDGMAGAIKKAQELKDSIPGSFMPLQFSNPANPASHVATAQEIIDSCAGKIDVLVAGVGTGGTLGGIAQAFKDLKVDCEIVAVEPDTSAVLSGKEPGPHLLQGIGAGFIPEVLDTKLIDKVVPVSAQDAGNTARLAAQKEGLLIGISGGAALYAALQLSKDKAYSSKRIVVILPDTGERYLSTWLFDK
jgi:cysteine synthase A